MQVLLRRQNHIDAQFFELAAGFPGSKIWIHQVKVGQTHIQARSLAVYGQIDRNLRLAAAVIANDTDYAA
jgi:hypothetical protein